MKVPKTVANHLGVKDGEQLSHRRTIVVGRAAAYRGLVDVTNEIIEKKKK